MVVRLHPEALAEVGEAVAFYEGKAPGLGPGGDGEDDTSVQLGNLRPSVLIGDADDLRGFSGCYHPHRNQSCGLGMGRSPGAAGVPRIHLGSRVRMSVGQAASRG